VTSTSKVEHKILSMISIEMMISIDELYSPFVVGDQSILNIIGRLKVTQEMFAFQDESLISLEKSASKSC
jgi:hypothetical protein